MHTRMVMVLAFLLVSVVAIADEGRKPLFEPTTISSSGHYILTRDISSAGLTITIDADDVILDLGGWEVTTTSAGRVIAITNGRRSVTVRNGTVTGGLPIDVEDGADRSADIVLQDLTLVSTGTYAIDMDAVDSVTVARCHVEGGIVRAAGRGQEMNGRFVDNVILDPGSRGFDLYNLSAGEITRNKIFRADGSIGHGIFVSQADPGGGNLIAYNVVRDFRTTDPGRGAIQIGSPGNTILGNLVTISEAGGINVFGNDSRIEDNHVTGCTTFGIQVSSDRNDVSGNTVMGNTGTGLLLTSATNDNTYDRNRSCANGTDLDDSGSGNVAGSDNIICVP